MSEWIASFWAFCRIARRGSSDKEVIVEENQIFSWMENSCSSIFVESLIRLLLLCGGGGDHAAHKGEWSPLFKLPKLCSLLAIKHQKHLEKWRGATTTSYWIHMHTLWVRGLASCKVRLLPDNAAVAARSFYLTMHLVSQGFNHMVEQRINLPSNLLHLPHNRETTSFLLGSLVSKAFYLKS